MQKLQVYGQPRLAMVGTSLRMGVLAMVGAMNFHRPEDTVAHTATTIDTTADKDLVITAAWTVADAGVFMIVDAATIEQVV